MTRADLVSLDRPALVALAEEADAVLDTLARPTARLPAHAAPRWLLVERVLLAAIVRDGVRAAA